jgi:parallel beta-helix repeat protein
MKRSRFAKRRTHQRGAARYRRLRLEFLEDRRLLASFRVNSVGDQPDADFDPDEKPPTGDGNCADISGACTLRAAIFEANLTPGPHTILFDLPAGSTTIVPGPGGLPEILQPVIIEGRGQPGYSDHPLVEISGALAGPGANGLVLKGGDSVVRGLAITRFIHDGSQQNGFGIVLDNGGGNLIEGNYLGINGLGTTAQGNASGLAIDDPSTANVIANNVISGNQLGGIQITASGNLVRGNRIGTDPSGTRAIANLARGVILWDKDGAVDAANNTIGGVTAEMRNLISGNRTGIEFEGVRATGNVVLGNYIGTDFTGVTPLPNTEDGIEIDDSPGNTIGGPTVESRNVISGNREVGVQIFGGLASGNLVQGNYIGTDFTARFAVGQSLTGVEIDNARVNHVDENVISGNSLYGVFIFGSDAQGNTVDGNLIGTDVTGMSDVGNGNAGVGIVGAVANVIGGTRRNVISGRL